MGEIAELEKPDPSIVGNALSAIWAFCVELELDLKIHVAAQIAIALRENTSFQWTPTTNGIRRITFQVQMVDGRRRFATVFNFDGEDPDLTEQLNNTITDATDGRWN